MLARTVVVDAVGIRASGGANVLLGLIRELAEQYRGTVFVLCVLPPHLRSFSTVTLERLSNIVIVEISWASRDVLRILWLILALPAFGVKVRCDAILSLANIAPLLWFGRSVVLLHQMHTISAAPSQTGKNIRQRLHSLVVKAGMFRADRIAVQTEAMRSCVCAWSPRLCRKVAVVKGGLCLNDRDVREAGAYPLPHNGPSGPLISFVSFAAEHKNFGTLLEAFAEVAMEIPGVRLCLTIDPSAEVSEEYSRCTAEVVRIISERNLGDTVSLVGVLDHSEVLRLLRASTVHVFLSRAESLGLPILEAMSLGVPQVLADLPYAHAVAGPAAVYADPDVPSSCAKMMLKVIQDKELRDLLCLLGKQRAREYSYSEMAAKVMELIDA